MKGSYLILIEVKRNFKKKIGALGKILFKKGYYCYVGSAMGNSVNIENRIFRHLKKRKKLRWHIDYLTSSKFTKIKEIVIIPSKKKLEEKISNFLSLHSDFTVKNFGSSDCKTKGNLHYFKSEKEFEKIKRKLNFIDRF